jgi:hypothetical protein
MKLLIMKTRLLIIGVNVKDPIANLVCLRWINALLVEWIIRILKMNLLTKEIMC